MANDDLKRVLAGIYADEYKKQELLNRIPEKKGITLDQIKESEKKLASCLKERDRRNNEHKKDKNEQDR